MGNDKIDSILSNNTLIPVDFSPDYKSIECKWKFITKYNTKSSIQPFKTILVVKGFTRKMCGL